MEGFTMNIEDILSMMDDVLDKSVAVPFSRGKCFIDVEKMNNLIQDIRANLPNEIAQARSVVSERKTLIADANREADEIIKRAEMRAKQMVAAQEITRLANARAQEIMETAQHKSKELRHTTNDYVDNMLGRAEELFGRNLAEVKKARNALKSGGKG
jgi:cell division septum initiation protein DivIVA